MQQLLTFNFGLTFHCSKWNFCIFKCERGLWRSRTKRLSYVTDVHCDSIFRVAQKV